MGKHKDDSGGSRREPYNQPIKIYADPNPDRVGDWRKIKEEVRRDLNAVRLGRAIDARVGKNIEYRRTRAGLSIEQFAKRMKISVTRLKKIEAGKEKLTLCFIQRIAAALGCFLSCELV